MLAPVVCHRIPEAALHLHLLSKEALCVFAVAEPSIPARKLVPDSYFQRKWLAQVSGLRDQGLEIRVWASELWDQGSGIKNQGSGIRTQGSGVVDRGSRLVTPQWLLYWLWRILCHNLIRLWWSQWHHSRRCLVCHIDRGLALTGCCQHLFLIIALTGRQDLKEESSSILPAMRAGYFSEDSGLFSHFTGKIKSLLVLRWVKNNQQVGAICDFIRKEHQFGDS